MGILTEAILQKKCNQHTLKNNASHNCSLTPQQKSQLNN